MSLAIAERGAKDGRRSLIGWTIAIVLFNLINVASWPSIRDAVGLEESLADYPESLKQLFGIGTDPLTSPVGYLNAQVFAFMGPVLLLILGIGRGSSAIAGDEEDGRLELLSALPVSRLRIFGERALIALGSVFVIGLVLAMSIIVFAPAFDLNIGVANVLAASWSNVLVGIVGGSVALAVGAATGRKSIAITVAVVLLAFGYVLQALTPVVDALEPLQYLSIFYWATRGEPLSNGFGFAPSLALLFASAVVLAAGAWRFNKRDLSS